MHLGVARTRATAGVALLLITSVLTAGTAEAADSLKQRLKKRHASLREKVFSVPLQPFTFDSALRRRPTAVRVAYQTPVGVRRGEPVNEYAYFIPRRLPRYNPPTGANEYSYDEDADVPDPAADIEGEDPQAEEDFAEDEPRFVNGRRPTVSGNRAVLRNGIAYAPTNAPARVKAAIWAANSLRGKPYRWGGGHASFFDRGYDCSGTVSFALHHAGVLSSPLPSRSFVGYGERGRGRWITIYARAGHTFAVIAGLRLDTTDFRGGREGPSWHPDMRTTYGYVARHPAGL